MALRAAIASGNWSNPATWNGGVLPGPEDVVASNGYTVTIDQNVNVDSITNASISPISDIPTMTYYTTPSGIASASTEYDYQYVAWKGFDGSTGNYWLTSNGVLTGWLAYEFTSAKVIAVYNIAGSLNNGFPKNWTFEGWNGSSWVILDTVVGNTNTSTYTGTFVNTTPYIKYRINVTLNNGGTYVSIGELKMYAANSYTSTTTAGGVFILNNGVTVTCTNSTNGFVSGSNALNGLIIFNLTTGQSATLVGNTQVTSASNTRIVYFNGIGTLNWVGRWEGVGAGLNSEALFVNTGTNGGIVNFTGDMVVNSAVIRSIVTVNKLFTFNMTGNIDLLQSSGNTIASSPFSINTSFNFNLIGGIYGGRSSVINTTQAIYFNQTGLIMSRINNLNVSSVAFVSTNASSIHLMSGPFICDIYGTLPYQVIRMHLIPSVGNYFEFRDETTNGALSPGAIAPATRLVSPATLVDNLAPANVRYGTTYALGTLTGTLRMPNANQVTYGIAVDNTFGNAVLTAASVWDYLISNITVENSIGMRLKNVSTPQITGEQLEAFLRLD